jgi:hypothetical protein
MGGRSDSGYSTASAPTTVNLNDGTYVMIRFRAQASAADVTQFLVTNQLSFAGGPSANGFFRVRVADTKVPKDEINSIVKKLQDDKVVSFIATTN